MTSSSSSLQEWAIDPILYSTASDDDILVQGERLEPQWSTSPSPLFSAPAPSTTTTPPPSLSLSTSQMWSLTLSRSRPHHSSFIYAVLTTHIYCRPTCPSRRPHLSNVLFFPSPIEAVAQGFKACKRCKPDHRVWGEDPLAVSHKETVRRAKDILRAWVDKGKKGDLKELAAETGVSEWHLHRVFKKEEGVTPERWRKEEERRRRGAIGGEEGLMDEWFGIVIVPSITPSSSFPTLLAMIPPPQSNTKELRFSDILGGVRV